MLASLARPGLPRADGINDGPKNCPQTRTDQLASVHTLWPCNVACRWFERKTESLCMCTRTHATGSQRDGKGTVEGCRRKGQDRHTRLGHCGPHSVKWDRSHRDTARLPHLRAHLLKCSAELSLTMGAPFLGRRKGEGAFGAATVNRFRKGRQQVWHLWWANENLRMRKSSKINGSP